MAPVLTELPAERVQQLAKSAAASVEWCTEHAVKLLAQLATAETPAERLMLAARALSHAQMAGVDIGLAMADNAIARVLGVKPKP